MKNILTTSSLSFLLLIGYIGAGFAGERLTDEVVQASSPEEPVITITAKKYEFTPSTITVQRWVPLVLELTSENLTQSFSLPDFEIHAVIKPGSTTRVRFTPDKTGSFSFSSDGNGGGGHAGVLGTLVVTDNEIEYGPR